MVGLHHIVRPFASWVVACNTVHESPGEGAWAAAVPLDATNAIGETAVIIANTRNRSLLMVDISYVVLAESHVSWERTC
jgi:hypothetical protein